MSEVIQVVFIKFILSGFPEYTFFFDAFDVYLSLNFFMSGGFMLMKGLAIVCVFSVAFLFGGLNDCLKPAQDKSGDHAMCNIDFIYTINLDQRPGKFQHCLNEFAPYGILPYRFSAVNGWELSLEQISDLGVDFAPWMKKDVMGTYYPVDGDGSPVHEMISVAGRKYFSHCMSRGAIGIVLSHMSILQDAYNSGYETIWVMEDDIQIIKDPHLISGLIDKLDELTGKKGWDILFTDQDTINRNGDYIPCRGYAKRPNFTPSNPDKFLQEPTIVSADFKKISARYGAYSMIVRRSGMKKILDFIRLYKVFLPYDMEFYFPNGIQLYTVREDIVSTLPDALSDNGRPGYLIGM